MPTIPQRSPAPPRIRPVPAVARAVAILRLLGQTDEPRGVSALARELDLVPSTCLHILRALAAEGLVAADPRGRGWMLGTGLVNLARRALRRGGFADRIQPGLDALSQRFRVAAIGVQVEGLDHMTVLAISRPELPIRLHVELGSRFPGLISATGRCLAAFSGRPWTEIAARFAALRWDQPPTLAQWRREVAEVHKTGYAVDRGNYIRGVTVLAVPVLDAAGSMTHAIVAVGISDQMREAGLPKIVRELRAIAGAAGG